MGSKKVKKYHKKRRKLCRKLGKNYYERRCREHNKSGKNSPLQVQPTQEALNDEQDEKNLTETESSSENLDLTADENPNTGQTQENLEIRSVRDDPNTGEQQENSDIIFELNQTKDDEETFNILNNETEKDPDFTPDRTESNINSTCPRRIVDMMEIENFGKACSNHDCGMPDIYFEDEIKRMDGLCSKFRVICRTCSEEVFIFRNAPDTYQTADGKVKSLLNFQMVMSEITAGGSYKKMSTTLGYCGLRGMHNETFIKLRNEIDEHAWILANEQMKIAGELEKANAILNNQFWWDPKEKVWVPAVKVKVDVAWSSTAHHHRNMSSNASEVVVIGTFTGMPLASLHRQKTCQECQRAHEAGFELAAEDHHLGKCFKNVAKNTSSKSMEPDLVFDAFSSARSTHGVVYLMYIADGDVDLESVLRKLEYGNQIKKIPCANHRIKNFRTEIEKLGKSHPRLSNWTGLTAHARASIPAGAMAAIKMRGEELERVQGKIRNLCQNQNRDVEVTDELNREISRITKNLMNDLKYGWKHQFGIHTNCSKDWCRVAAKSNDSGEVLKDIYEDWDRPESKANKRGKAPTDKEIKDFFQIMHSIADRLADDHTGLVNNDSTNACENKFSVRQNILSKQASTTRAGAFHTSVALSTLRLCLGPEYISHLYKKCTGQDPPPYFQKFIETIKQKAEYSKKYQAKEKTKKRRRILKQQRTGIRSKSRIRGHGDTEDLSKKEMMDLIIREKCVLKENLRKPSEENIVKSELFLKEVSSSLGVEAVKELKDIIGSGSQTKRTVFLNQNSHPEEWATSRHSLLTASNFYKVLSKRNGTDCAPTVEDIMYPKDLSKKPQIKYGRENEKNAIAALKNSREDLVIVDSLGLFQNEKYPWIAATPDGLIFDKSKPVNNQWGTLEVKCPYSCRDSVPEDAKHLFAKNGKLKRTHQYYRQIQGQMGCAGVSWAMFVVWTEKKIHTETIYLDKLEWEKSLVKLDHFWTNAYAPELIDGRVTRGGSVRSWKFQDGDIWKETSENLNNIDINSDSA